MRYWSTTSPAGCVQVRVMVVGSGEELLKAVGEDGMITITTCKAKPHNNSVLVLRV